jgi:hypothetical protein
MSSIGSTLNTINASLLSEISSYQATQARSNPTATSATATTSSDQVDFSQVAQLFKQLRHLQQSNPAEFKQVLTDAATQLKAAASQTTDPQQAAVLNNLANRFQTAASSGNTSALTSDPDGDAAKSSASTSTNATAANPYAAHAGHFHRHHGGGGISSLIASVLGSSTAAGISAATPSTPASH